MFHNNSVGPLPIWMCYKIPLNAYICYLVDVDVFAFRAGRNVYYKCVGWGFDLNWKTCQLVKILSIVTESLLLFLWITMYVCYVIGRLFIHCCLGQLILAFFLDLLMNTANSWEFDCIGLATGLVIWPVKLATAVVEGSSWGPAVTWSHLEKVCQLNENNDWCMPTWNLNFWDQ